MSEKKIGCCAPTNDETKLELTSQFLRTYGGEWIRISTIISIYVEESFFYDNEESKICILIMTCEGSYTLAKGFKTREDAQIKLDALMKVLDYGKDCE